MAEGVVEPAAGSFRLTATGKDVTSRILDADRDRWGSDRGAAVLDSFHDLDRRVKEVVTAWQMREADGSQALNDHGDPVYDGLVLDRLGALHGDAVAWLALDGRPDRAVHGYRDRLDRAARLAADGDGRYVASPRVDSYHSVWFELHEDLILLSGRTRADEVAAGRA